MSIYLNRFFHDLIYRNWSPHLERNIHRLVLRVPDQSSILGRTRGQLVIRDSSWFTLNSFTSIILYCIPFFSLIVFRHFNIHRRLECSTHKPYHALFNPRLRYVGYQYLLIHNISKKKWLSVLYVKLDSNLIRVTI